MEKIKPKLLIIGGPTASGKSSLGLGLAQVFGGEIVGADSMQIYKGMDIGTGKLRKDERQGINHRMIDIIEPSDSYSAGQYCKDAEREIDDVISVGRLPIIVGGTGLYINALINSYNFAGVCRNDSFRDELRKKADEFGIQSLHKQLEKLDPVAAQNTSSSDLKRLIRALEICHQTGGQKSSLAASGESKYNCLMLNVQTDRESLYRAINMRVDDMIASGLADEVQGLKPSSEWQSMKAIGYKEVLPYLNGEITLSEMAELIKLNTRHYAKRQITYFKNIFPFAKWIDPTDSNTIHSLIKEFLAN